MSSGRIYQQGLSLLTDLYQLTMACGFERAGIADSRAVYQLTFRRAPDDGQMMVACGLRPLLEALEEFRFDASDLEYVGSLQGKGGVPLFDGHFMQWLADLELRLDVSALPEGSVCFAGGPVVRIEGPLAQCQLVETLVLNQMNYASAIATKAARICHVAANGQPVLEFGLRRAPEVGGGVAASRAAWIGGCAATSNLMAGRLVEMPVRGTHAHSWVMAFDTEMEAFEAYVDAMPHNAVLLVDTYDTRQGVELAIRAARRLAEKGEELSGLRIDSGDLLELSRWARRRLDEEGLGSTRLVASGGLDEYRVAALRAQGAPIDTWGVGTALVSAAGIDGVYKMGLIERDGRVVRRMKSTDDPRKASLPGCLQVRRRERDGLFCGDTIYDESLGTPQEGGRDLLVPVMSAGRIVAPLDDRQARERVRESVAKVPADVRRLESPASYPVALAPSLREAVEAQRSRALASASGPEREGPHSGE